jgi:hypothetical protein
VAKDAQPALLGAQDRQRPQQAAEEPATEGQAGAPGDLDGRDQEGCGHNEDTHDIHPQVGLMGGVARAVGIPQGALGRGFSTWLDWRLDGAERAILACADGTLKAVRKLLLTAALAFLPGTVSAQRRDRFIIRLERMTVAVGTYRPAVVCPPATS